MASYQTPRGTQDILPSDSRKWLEVEELIRSVCYYYGYDEMGFGHYNPSNGEWYYALDDNSPYLEMLKFFKIHLTF